MCNHSTFNVFCLFWKTRKSLKIIISITSFSESKHQIKCHTITDDLHVRTQTKPDDIHIWCKVLNLTRIFKNVAVENCRWVPTQSEVDLKKTRWVATLQRYGVYTGPNPRTFILFSNCRGQYLWNEPSLVKKFAVEYLRGISKVCLDRVKKILNVKSQIWTLCQNGPKIWHNILSG